MYSYVITNFMILLNDILSVYIKRSMYCSIADGITVQSSSITLALFTLETPSQLAFLVDLNK